MMRDFFAKESRPNRLCFFRASGIVRTAFTLIEIMLAVTIMALISLAVINVFRVATDSFKAGNRETQVLQRGRFIFDALEKDLSQTFYLPEDQYNVAARTKIEEFQQELLETEEKNNFRDFEKKYGPQDKREKGNPDYIGNPFEKYKLIDLQLIGEDGSDLDQITFSTKANLSEGAKYLKYGLRRVHYQVDGKFLIRSEDTIEAKPRDWMGEPLPKEVPPTHTILAEGVEQFNLQYGFWVDNTWFEADHWDSTGKQLRNSNYILGEYDFQKNGTSDNLENQNTNTGTSDVLSNDSLNDSRSEPFDGLPMYIRVSIVLADPREEGSKKLHLTRMIQIPGAVETWTENERMEERDRENEVILRRDEYLEVFPGTLKKR